jgi:hypothetical protein
MSSLGVVIPTKNSLAYLPPHLEGMAEWLDLAAEVVVVDSFSSDGTLDYLRNHLRHPEARFLTHPPGLYASWNHGIAQISAKYVYISTIGDIITRAGLQRLMDSAEALGADVVLSKPRFRASRGEQLPDVDWPIDEIIRELHITRPRRLHKLEAVLFAMTNLTAALTGSCASDLFRTEVLQRHPFPSDFGTIGDGPWGIQHAADLVWAVVPERFSSFLKHPSNASEDEKTSYRRASRLDQVAREAVAAARQTGTLAAKELDQLKLDDLLQAGSAYLDSKSRFDQLRKSKLPWILQPRAWRVRLVRNRAATQLQALKTQALRAIVAGSAGTSQPIL